MTRTAFRLLTCLFLPASLCLADARAENAALAAKAQGIFKAYCYRCHGPSPESYNGFRYVLDRERLVARGKVVPGKPSESKLLQRVVRGEMPPEGEKIRPTQGDM